MTAFFVFIYLGGESFILFWGNKMNEVSCVPFPWYIYNTIQKIWRKNQLFAKKLQSNCEENKKCDNKRLAFEH